MSPEQKPEKTVPAVVNLKEIWNGATDDKKRLALLLGKGLSCYDAMAVLAVYRWVTGLGCGLAIARSAKKDQVRWGRYLASFAEDELLILCPRDGLTTSEGGKVVLPDFTVVKRGQEHFDKDRGNLVACKPLSGTWVFSSGSNEGLGAIDDVARRLSASLKAGNLSIQKGASVRCELWSGFTGTATIPRSWLSSTSK